MIFLAPATKTSHPSLQANERPNKEQTGASLKDKGEADGGSTKASKEQLTALFIESQGGDRRAQQKLFEALRPVLLQCIRSAVRQRNYRLTQAQIDDVLQELLFDIWRFDMHRFDPSRGELLTFLRKRIQWKLVDHIRVHARHHCDSLERRLEELNEEPGQDESNPECLHAQFSWETYLTHLPERVEEQLLELNDASAQQAVIRHDIDGIPLKQVAQELGIHPSNATRARKRGLVFLQNTWSDEWRQAA